MRHVKPAGSSLVAVRISGIEEFGIWACRRLFIFYYCEGVAELIALKYLHVYSR